MMLLLLSLCLCVVQVCLGAREQAFVTVNSLEKELTTGVSDKLTTLLFAIPFANEGTVHRSDQFGYEKHFCQYLEPENVTKTQSSWLVFNESPYLAQLPKMDDPPMGMRSSVNVGGIVTGTFEVRADGSFREWTIENNSPAGAAKVPLRNDAVLGFKVEGEDARVLRTHPPGHGIPGVETLTYSGAYPFSRWRVDDEESLAKHKLAMTTHAFSRVRVGSLDTTATPAVLFTFTVENKGSLDKEVEVFLNMPMGMDENMARSPSPQSLKNDTHSMMIVGKVNDHTECKALCDKAANCTTWTLFTREEECVLTSTDHYPLNLAYFHDGAVSGVFGTWTNGQTHDQFTCMNLQRPYKEGSKRELPYHGNIALCGDSDGTTFMTGNSLEQILENINKGKHGIHREETHGTVLSKMTIPAGKTVTKTLAFGYYFPHRDYLSENIGNFYQHSFRSSTDAAVALMRDVETVAKENLHLVSLLLGKDNATPEWLGDVLINSLHQTRTGWKMNNGQFRQWEAYDCTNVDSVHNDGERSIPYIMLFPESTRSRFEGWAASQGDDGMILEQLANGCFHVPKLGGKGGGRVMSDVTSMFLVYALALVQWGGQNDIVKEFWPVLKKAAEWQIAQSKEIGVPQHLVDTYDSLSFSSFNATLYNGMFHVLAMKATAKLAALAGDEEMHNTTLVAAQRGMDAIDALFWMEDLKAYRAATSGNSMTFSDSMYAQVWAHSLGLGALVNRYRERAGSHLQKIARDHDTPWGLKCFSNATIPWRGINHYFLDSIWMMASANVGSLMIWTNTDTLENALTVGGKSVNHWRMKLKDLWNIAGSLGGNGTKGGGGWPLVTSHYGYHMVSWHILLALSGYSYDSISKTLELNPKLLSVGKYLPVLIPGRIAFLRRMGQRKWTLSLFSGPDLILNHFKVSHCKYYGQELVHLKPGQNVTVDCESKKRTLL